MKKIARLLLSSLALLAQADDQPLDKNSSSIQAWASGVRSVSYGTNVYEDWKKSNNALGQAEGTSFDIVCLGRGGQITLTFPNGISNGAGNDFAVFENGFSANFLELGWVEVSTDGEHFVRFLNASQTKNKVGGFGTIEPTHITGLASKFMQGIGTQFDLSLLQSVYNDQTSAAPWLSLTPAFKNQIVNNFPHLDLNSIQYVRIIDIVGNGSAKDAYGNIIYDPYPTTGSAGFDLDAIAVLHEGSTEPPPPPNTFANWAYSLGLSGTPSDDTDGDGAADLEEYLLGTSPINSAEKSTFHWEIQFDRFDITYNRAPDAIGRIDITTITDLSQTNWVVATPDSISTNGTEITISLPHTKKQSFFRLRFDLP